MDREGMPKVVHLITGLNTGGAETALYRLLAGTDLRRFPSVVVSLGDEGDLGARIGALGVPVHAMRVREGMGHAASAPLRLVRLLRRERPDVLQTWLYHADLAGAALARMAGVPALAWNLRCSAPEPGATPRNPPRLLRLLRALSRVPDAVVVNARAGREFHEAVGYRPREWRLIANGIDLDAFCPAPALRARTRAALGVGDDVPVVGMVARFDALKDHETFLGAAAALRARRPDVVFVLAGRDVTDDNAALVGRVDALGLRGAVRLLGPRTDVAALYPAFDVAALSSIAEGFPNVLAEAMACGVPCVSTDAGDAAVLVGDTGRVVPVRDPGAMADAWAALLSLAPEARARLGAAARARIGAEFSLAAAVERYESLYLHLSGRPSPARRPAAAPAAAGPRRLP
jgi:glycosyltransferase involved in cell wall biosynthesis